MTYASKKKSNITYFFFNVILYLVLLYYSGIIITKGIIFLTIATGLVYYLSGMLDLSKKKYSYIILSGLVINFILFTVFTLKIGLIFVEKSIILYAPMLFVHTFFKVFLVKILETKEKCLVLGDIDQCDYIDELMSKHDKYEFAGFVNVKENHDLKNIIEQKDISTIVIATQSSLNFKITEKLLNLRLQGIKVLQFTTFYEKLEEKIPVKAINEKWLLFSQGFDIIHNSWLQRIKRVTDIVLSIIIIVLSLPLTLLFSILIKLESRGPLFFIQERIGKGNKPFKIIKFRSMTKDAEKDGPKWAGKNDSRVTFIGKIIRKTRIDEIPQLINVLKGEMSFIGPRPERQFFINTLEEKIPFYYLRHSVLPGLTGWAQVNYPYGASVEDALEKLQYDLYYIKHQSLFMDIVIVLKTIKIVLFGQGR